MQGLNVGGLEMMVVNLANNLPDHYKVTLCCYDDLGVLQENVKTSSQVKLIKRNPGFDIPFIDKLVHLLIDNKISILHAHNNTAFFYGTIAGRLAGIKKIIYTEHGRTMELSRSANLAQRILSRYVDHTVVVAGYLLDLLKNKEGFPSHRLTFIPNGIDDAEYHEERNRSEICTKLSLNENDRFLGVIARLDPIKNHKLLINSLKTISAANQDVKLLIVGDGPEKDRLQEQVQALHLEETALFLGERRDVPDILSILDIFVLPSLSEGMSITLIEAMAAAKPIVATNVGGNPIIISNLKTGVLVESDNERALSQQIMAVLDDQTLAHRLGQAARKDFEAEYTVEKMVQRYLRIYEN